MALSKEVFLSYGHDPQRVDGFVKTLKADLEAAGISVWLDKTDIRVGSDWRNKIGNGVHECRALLCVLTSKYMSSSDCTGELFQADDKNKLIFPVLYEDIDWNKDESSRGVGYVVKRYNWADFRRGEDYQVAVKKLIEGMNEKGKHSMQGPFLLLSHCFISSL